MEQAKIKSMYNLNETIAADLFQGKLPFPRRYQLNWALYLPTSSLAWS